MNTDIGAAKGLGQRGRTIAMCCAAVLALGGCAGALENVVVSLPAYDAGGGAAAAPRATVRVDPVRDARTNAVGSLIGERTTIGNVSMGAIEMKPLPTAAMSQMLRAELARMGFRVADSGERFRISAQLQTFQVTTPATALYWDMDGVIELAVTATGPDGRKHDARYAAKCTDRTYVFPSEELIRNVVATCVKDIGAKVRGDGALNGFLDAR